MEYFEAENVDDLARHMSRLYHDSERCHTLAENTCKFNEKYNWARQGETYIQLVTHLALQNRQAPIEKNLAPDPLKNEPL